MRGEANGRVKSLLVKVAAAGDPEGLLKLRPSGSFCVIAAEARGGRDAVWVCLSRCRISRLAQREDVRAGCVSSDTTSKWGSTTSVAEARAGWCTSRVGAS